MFLQLPLCCLVMGILLDKPKGSFINKQISERKLDNFQHCLLLALLSCFHSSGINKNEQRFSKFSKHSAESES